MKILPPSLVTTRSHEYLDDFMHMSVVRMLSVANTLALPSAAAFLKEGRGGGGEGGRRVWCAELGGCMGAHVQDVDRVLLQHARACLQGLHRLAACAQIPQTPQHIFCRCTPSFTPLPYSLSHKTSPHNHPPRPPTRTS